jgi:bifunctional DNase/RNase
MATEKEPPARKMEVRGLMMDPSSKTPIVILREEGGEAELPIWIGAFEANAIAISLEGVEVPRPMTHDLLGEALVAARADVEKILIHDLRDSTFFATIFLKVGGSGEVAELDSRPSDAIALALRTKAPIYVAEKVLEAAQSADVEVDGSERERLRRWLEDASSEDLGDYEM